jgi:hypothetical protein
MPKILILRGNRGVYPDEQGRSHSYPRGALHEAAAKEYARRKGYEGLVLDVAGNALPSGNRSHTPQTLMALTTFRADNSVSAFYGFSGGGYDVWWILRSLTSEELKRVKLVVVLGAPDRPQSEFDSSSFKGASWELVYKTNPPASAAVVPRGAGSHMFGPEWLLSQTPDPGKTSPAPIPIPYPN